MSKFNLGEFSKNGKEFRKVSELRASDSSNNTLEGYALVFNSKTNINDWFYEVIDRNALITTDFSDVAMYFNHDVDQVPLARLCPKRNCHTLQLSVDDHGLKIHADLDVENNVDARKVYSAISRGDMSGMSFMFIVKDQEWLDLDSDMPTRVIKSISVVFEVSAVNYPAYESTEIYARSLSALQREKNALVDAKKQALKRQIEKINIIKKMEN